MVVCSLIASSAIRAFISALKVRRCLDFISAPFPRQRFYTLLSGPNFGEHFRDRIFRGAKNQVEVAAAAKPQYGNLKVAEVAEGNRADNSVSVTLRRTEILQLETSDRELMNEFIKKNRQ